MLFGVQSQSQNDSTFFYDSAPGLVLAFSSRKVVKSYDGFCMKVRRQSDNAEIDIGFVGNSLDTDALESFVAGTDAYLVTWYNQSSFGGDATQTNSSNQPEIAASGVVNKVNGFVSPKFDGSSSKLEINSLSLYRDVSYAQCYAVLNPTIGATAAQAYFEARTNGSSSRIWRDLTSSGTARAGGRRQDAFDSFDSVSSTSAPGTEPIQITNYNNYAESDAFIYFNGTLEGENLNFHSEGNTSDNDSSAITLGANASLSQVFNGLITEYISFNENTEAYKSLIESKQAEIIQ